MKVLRKHGKLYVNETEKKNRCDNFMQNLVNVDPKNVVESHQVSVSKHLGSK